LQRAATERPELAEREEYRAILDGDEEALARLGQLDVVGALVELHEGISPEAFEARARAFVAEARHPRRGVPFSQTRYQPMLELIDELRSRSFSVFIVSGGGTEFVRAIAPAFYGVSAEGVVGSQVGYRFVREGGTPRLERTADVYGSVNEGPEKVSAIQRVLGRRPILAGGNSAGDKEMLEYAAASEGPSLALLVNHDDAEREYAAASEAGTFTADESVLDTAARLDWTVASIRDDWSSVYAAT
jgi:phosphoserine phosphatase